MEFFVGVAATSGGQAVELGAPLSRRASSGLDEAPAFELGQQPAMSGPVAAADVHRADPFAFGEAGTGKRDQDLALAFGQRARGTSSTRVRGSHAFDGKKPRGQIPEEPAATEVLLNAGGGLPMLSLIPLAAAMSGGVGR